jgi:hypothetical protein
MSSASRSNTTRGVFRPPDACPGIESGIVDQCSSWLHPNDLRTAVGQQSAEVARSATGVEDPAAANVAQHSQ